MKTQCWVWTLAPLALLIAGCSQTPVSMEALPTETDAAAEYRRKVEALIAQLRSPNRNPNPNNHHRESFPDDYDDDVQEKVEIARKKLIVLGKDAFPILIEHVNDEGYSLSFYTAILRGFSVGEVCFMIIRNQVDLAGMTYKGRAGHGHHGYFSQYCKEWWYTQEGMRKWWMEHRHQSLRDMQIEALRWAVRRERKIGFPGKDDKKRYLDPLLAKLRRLEQERSNVTTQPRTTSVSVGMAFARAKAVLVSVGAKEVVLSVAPASYAERIYCYALKDGRNLVIAVNRDTDRILRIEVIKNPGTPKSQRESESVKALFLGH